MIELINCDYKEVLNKIDENFIVVTDPPFNVGYHYSTYNDRMKESEYLNMLTDLQHLTKKSVLIHYPETLYKLSAFNNITPERVVSWVYNSNTPRQHRDICFYGVKPVFSQVTQPYKNPNDKRIKERIAKGYTGSKLYDWFNINQVKNVSKKNSSHPCQMPLDVMLNVIGILPKEYKIFEPFSVSGTTALACKILNRDCIACEIDKQYYEESFERLRDS